MLLLLLLLLLILLVWRLPTLVYPPRAWPLGDGILTRLSVSPFFSGIQFLFHFCGVKGKMRVFVFL